jgi:hypothetical protein
MYAPRKKNNVKDMHGSMQGRFHFPWYSEVPLYTRYLLDESAISDLGVASDEVTLVTAPCSAILAISQTMHTTLRCFYCTSMYVFAMLRMIKIVLRCRRASKLQACQYQLWSSVGESSIYGSTLVFQLCLFWNSLSYNGETILQTNDAKADCVHLVCTSGDLQLTWMRRISTMIKFTL